MLPKKEAPLLSDFFNKSVGTFGTADFDFSPSPGNSYFLAASGTFEMFIGFSFFKIRSYPDPPVFCLIPESHEFLIFGSSFNDVF